jgi:hypothetical protein
MPYSFTDELLRAQKGNAEAQYNVAQDYFEGKHVVKNNGAGLEWLKKSADAGYADAQERLAHAYEHGNYGLALKSGMAAIYCLLAANQDHELAICRLAYFYENGFGVDRDYKRAAELYRRAIKKDNAYAYGALGWLYDYGLGVDKDIGKAHEYYELAAQKGNSNAQRNLGNMLYLGRGVPKDKEAGIKWLQLAAADGQKLARGNLWSYSQQDQTMYGVGSNLQVTISQDENRMAELEKRVAYMESKLAALSVFPPPLTPEAASASVNSYLLQWGGGLVSETKEALRAPLSYFGFRP